MKNHLTFFVFGCILLMSMQGLNAQIVNICVESDSVTLTLDNYQFGNIQWQRSTDNMNWENIEGAIFHHYTCLPEKSGYYRAWISYQNCPPDSSQVSFLQRKVKANAGPDKVLNTGYTTKLFANNPSGTIGHWSVLSGNDAQLSEPDSSYTLFYGSDSLYRLCWTLTGACGTSHDTIEISYVTNIYNSNVVFVDSTDIILSDSAEMENGSCRILFSNPVSISYATILVGLQGDGFLRKVQSCIYIGDTCCMNTVQATLSDLLVYGTIHIEDFASMIYGQENAIPGAVRLDHCPTRAEILSDTIFSANKMYYYMETVDEPDHLLSSEDKNAIISFPGLGSPINIASGVQITGFSMECQPNLGFESFNSWNEPVSISFGSYNGDFETKLKLRFPDQTVNITGKETTIWKKKIRLRVMVGGFPIFTSLNFRLSTNLSCHVTVAVPFEVELRQHTSYDAQVFLKQGVPGRVFDVHGELTGEVIDVNDVSNGIDVGIDVSLIGEIAVTFYGSVSAYFDIGPNVGWSLCAGFDVNGHWGNQQGITAKGVAQIGLRPAALLHFLGDWDLNYPFEFLKKDFRRPNRLGYVSGNNQLFAGSFQPLPQPIRVKSYTYFNNPSANHFVYFEPVNGGTVNSLDYHFVTDADGIAEAIWSPESPNSKLKVGMFDCEGNYIDGGPIIISTAGDVCTNSTLTTNAYLDGGMVLLQVSGGVLPYQYSLDGTTWTDQYTPFAPVIGTEYTIHVKDAQNCVTTATYCRPSLYNEIMRLDSAFSIPLTDCYIYEISVDELSSDCDRWFVFEGPSGGVAFYLGEFNAHITQLATGTYTGVLCDNLEVDNPGAYNFCADYSYLFDSDVEEDDDNSLATGSILYSQENSHDVFTFTFTDEYGHEYMGAFKGFLYYMEGYLRK